MKNYQRWVELARILPILNELLSSRVRLSDTQKAETKQKQELDSTLERVRLAEEQEESLGREHDEQTKLISAYQENLINASNRQLELNPVIVLLERLDANRLKRENYLKDLSEFPPELQNQLTNALEREAHLSESARAVAWLRNLVDYREKLRNAVTKRDSATKELARSQSDLEEASLAQQKAHAAHDQARQAVSNANSLLAIAQAHLDEIRAKETRFSEVEGGKVCRYCGSDLSVEHVEHEREIIQAELAEAEKNFNTAHKVVKVF